MSEMLYRLVGMGEDQTLTVFEAGRPLVATNGHPYWDKILQGVLAGDESVIKYFDMKELVVDQFKRLSERVTLVGNQIAFDGDIVDNSLTQQIIRSISEGNEDFQPYVYFFEKVMTNPNEHSREQLFRFLQQNPDGFSVADNGDIVGYKGVMASGREGFTYQSVNSGTNRVWVDGTAFTGHVPQNVGSIVEMARAEVMHDPSVSCAPGLHVSTYSYAQSWGRNGGMLRVLVNPRDFVSVPNEGNSEKCRVSRYKVDAVITEPTKTALFYTSQDEDDEDEEWCWDCDNWASDCEC